MTGIYKLKYLEKLTFLVTLLYLEKMRVVGALTFALAVLVSYTGKYLIL